MCLFFYSCFGGVSSAYAEGVTVVLGSISISAPPSIRII